MKIKFFGNIVYNNLFGKGIIFSVENDGVKVIYSDEIKKYSYEELKNLEIKNLNYSVRNVYNFIINKTNIYNKNEILEEMINNYSKILEIKKKEISSFKNKMKYFLIGFCNAFNSSYYNIK